MKETAMKVLRSFGLDKEIELYLQMFQKTPAHKFAVIKISGSTLEEKVQLVAEDVAFLSKLGLTPIVIHGGGKQIDKELTKKGIVSAKVNGLRVTDMETMKVVKKTISNLSGRLANEINERGGRAINATEFELIEALGVGTANGVDLGFVGSVKKVKIDKIKESCKSGYVPILGCIGYVEGQPYNINADILASWLVKKMQPKKFILVTETGGILDKNGGIISTIDIRTDLPELIKSNVITEGMLLKVKEIEALLERAPMTVVEVCSAQNILQELFTVKGSGTFIRHGGNFLVKKDFGGLSKEKIKKLLEESFSKNLVEDYFKQPVECVIVDKEYTGLMIVKKIGGAHYLDKLAIAKSAQGNGLAKAMWTFVKTKYPSLIWRASPSNPINNWYFKNCDGVEKCDSWIVFWYGIGRMKANELIPAIINIPKTLVKP